MHRISGGVAEFIGDIASLAELQAQLAAVDLREAARKSAVPIAFILVGFVVVVGAVPVAFLGAGWLLAFALQIPQGWALLMMAGIALLTGGLLAGLGSLRLRHSFNSFAQSRKQLWLNLAWVRAVLITTASSRLHARRRS